MGNHIIRKRIRALLILTIMLALCSCASAYYLYIDAPTNLRLGEDIYVEGSTNTPPPDVIHIVLSQVSNIPVEVDRFSISIDERGENTFNVTFSTSGLEAGRYRIEGIADSKRNFSGDSRILRVVTLEDRTNEVSLTGQREQWVSDVLKVTGNIRDFKDTSVSFELKKDGETVFGPAQVPVAYGHFDYDVPASEPGTYMLSISDYRGLIGEYQYVLHSEDGGSTTSSSEIVRPTAEPTQQPVVTTGTTEPTSVPTTAPTSAATVTATAATTATTTTAASITPVDETTADFEYDDRLSRAEAGFYIIEPNENAVVITTTTGVDWVIEYIDPITKSKHRVNDADANNAESAEIMTDGMPLYVKIYPYSFNEVADITVFGSGISSMYADNKARIAFGSPPSSDLEGKPSSASGNANSSESSPESPVSLITLLFGGSIGAWLFMRRNL